MQYCQVSGNKMVNVQAHITAPACNSTSTHEAAVMSQRAASALALPVECSPAVTEGSHCVCGTLWSDATKCIATRQGVQSFIFHMAKVQHVTVYQLKCHCGEVLQYDGVDDAVLNLNNVDLFTHEVLKWYKILPHCCAPCCLAYSCHEVVLSHAGTAYPFCEPARHGLLHGAVCYMYTPHYQGLIAQSCSCWQTRGEGVHAVNCLVLQL